VTSFFKGNLSSATLLQLGADASWLCIAFMLALHYTGSLPIPLQSAFVPAIVFAVAMIVLSGAFGLYRRDTKLAFGAHCSRMLLALLIGAPIVYLVAHLLPEGERLRDALDEAVLFAFVGLIFVRHVIVSPLVRTFFPHRVLVLGTGPEARVVEASLTEADHPNIRLVGFYALEKTEVTTVTANRIIARVGLLEDTVKRLGVKEIIVAVRQQRGGVLPLRSLLECRLNGVQVTDLARFFERVHGHVPIESLKASWLIYGDGFRQSWLRRFVKRTFDLIAAGALLIVALPVMAIVSVLIAIESGFPLIYRQERVGLLGIPYTVFKFRSMNKDAERDGRPAWAAANDARVTALGRFIRRTRIDELPQLINVLKGEMSLVGPRPERPVFVKMLTEQIQFYGVRHCVKPGITGWAQVRYSYGASVEQSMRKLEYDLYYVKNHTVFLDVLVLLETVRVVLMGEGAR
jgi:sugar transferase (PEP-CTERM system associated)